MHYWSSKQELGVDIFNKRLEKISSNSIVAIGSVTIKMNNKYNLKIVQVYAPTCNHINK